MSTHTAVIADPVDRIKRIPRPEEPVPRIAWPTMGLLAFGVAGWSASTGLYLAGSFPWWATVIVNGILGYWTFFTVFHEASHNAASTIGAVNVALGRFASFMLIPYAAFPTLRFINMQHHRFTGVEGQDPDFHASQAPGWRAPVGWVALDLGYWRYYLSRFGARPTAEKREFAVVTLGFVGLVAATAATGHLTDLLVIVILPSRLALLQIAAVFDWLPHHGLRSPDRTVDQMAATRNRIGLERILTPLMWYHNYHLIHHLHPVIPFSRYIAVWRRHEEEYLDCAPHLTTWSGRPLTQDEYRRIRELQEH